MPEESRSADDWMQWLDSYEGLPSPIGPDEAEALGLRARGYRSLEGLAALAPGLLLAGALALAGMALGEGVLAWLLGLEQSPVSPILVAILLGLAIRNGFGLPAAYDAGLRLCARRVLQVGVALLGMRLSLGTLGEIGLVALPIVVACIGTALVVVTRINLWLGLPRRLGILIAVGTGICGNTAIVATAPVIGAREDEVSYAVACVTLFGLLGLVGYPFLSHWLFAGDATMAGLFLGTAIHDTAQVAGAGVVYQQVFGSALALDTAAVTKLLRNLFMLAVIPLMAVVWQRGRRRPATIGVRSLRALVPGFVFFFLGLTLLRSLGDLGPGPAFGLLPEPAWEGLIAAASSVSTACLAVAMASVGLGTRFDRLRGIGLAPFAVGIAAALLVGAVSYLCIRLLPGVAPG